MENVIEVTNLSKKFCYTLRRGLFYTAADIMKRTVGLNPHRDELRLDEFWALKDISFSLQRGKALGIIGENGAGKTTLLRIIYGIFPPDKGIISVRGRIGALISVGAGFHPNLTGRENIFLNGHLIGMSRAEIKDKMRDIIEFAEIGRFIDSPVSTYSSGMVVRLGFSISIHAVPDILIADEVLAVGDLGFALKCYKKIADYQSQGGSILLVSHSMQLVRNVCQRAVWIKQGEVAETGESSTVCSKFENYLASKSLSSGGSTDKAIFNYDKRCKILGFFVNSSPISEVDIDPSVEFKVTIRYSFQRPVKNPLFSFAVVSSENIILISSYSQLEGLTIESLEGDGEIEVKIQPLGVKPGKYFVTFVLAENNMGDVIEWHERAHVLNLVGNRKYSDGLLVDRVVWR